MAGEWKYVTIGEIATLQRGFDISQKEQRPGPVPVISSGGTASFHDEAKQAGPGVIMGRKGTLGSVYWIDKPYWPHSTSLWVKDFHGNDPKFVYYFFKAMGPELLRMDVGAANPTLNRNHVHPLPALRPPLPAQRAIASVLGTLDDLIEVNRETNEALEEMARALFKSWFVDFDPVRAKLEGRPPAGMDAATAALFPDHFQDSELGQIPKGWEVGKVSDFASLGRVAVNPGNYPSELFDHYSLPAFDDGRVPKLENGDSIMSNKFLVESDAVLLSKLNPHIPRVWLPDLHASRRSVCSTEFMVARAISGATREYLFSLFTNPYFASIYDTLVSGTTGSHQRISPESFLQMQIIVPPIPLIKSFTNAVKPMFDTAHSNINESRDLATLRDTLLPKLLSGEVSVERVEKRLAEIRP